MLINEAHYCLDILSCRSIFIDAHVFWWLNDGAPMLGVCVVLVTNSSPTQLCPRQSARLLTHISYSSAIQINIRELVMT